MHECRYHHVVVMQYEKYAVVSYFCICDRRWRLDVLRIEELAAEEIIGLTVEQKYSSLVR